MCVCANKIYDKRDEMALWALSVFLWSSLVRRARNGHESVMYSETRISREY